MWKTETRNPFPRPPRLRPFLHVGLKGIKIHKPFPQTSRAEAFRCSPVGSARTLSNGMMSGSDFLRWLTAPISSGVRVAAASAAMELP